MEVLEFHLLDDEYGKLELAMKMWNGVMEATANMEEMSGIMNPQEKQQVAAHNDKWVLFSERVKISSTNIRLATTQFWYAIKKLQGTDSYEFLLANKKCTVNAKVFRKILDICLRVECVDFTDVPDDDIALTFLIDIGYKGLLYKHANMFVDHMHQPWRALAAIINKCLSGMTSSNDKLEKYRIDILTCSGKEPVKEPIAKVVMNDAGDDVVLDKDQPQDASKPKTTKTLNLDWFKQPPRPPTPDLEWNKRQVVLDQPEQPWFSQMVFATKDPLTFNDLMTNPEGDNYPFDLSKPLPLQGPPGHRTVAVDYFYNNDREYLKTSDPELFHLDGSDIVEFIVALRIFTRSLILKRRVRDLQLGVESYQKKLNITEPQKTFLEIEFKEPYTPSYIPPRIVYEDLNKQKRVLQADELYKFSDGILKSFCDKIHHRVLDFRLDYNKEMPTRKYTAVDHLRVLQADELYKFSDGILKSFCDKIHHRVLDFRLDYNKEMPTRKYTAVDHLRSGLMIELIDKQMREREIIKNLEQLIGARELEMDYKLMTCTV
nr:hypothetical protein [Tanacetum cinerariifolium]